MTNDIEAPCCDAQALPASVCYADPMRPSRAQRREVIATAALAAILSSTKWRDHCGNDPTTHPAVVAIEMADKLLQLLREREEE